MWATQRGHVRMVQVLLEAGADATKQKPDGTLALDIAALNGHQQVIGMTQLLSVLFICLVTFTFLVYFNSMFWDWEATEEFCRRNSDDKFGFGRWAQWEPVIAGWHQGIRNRIWRRGGHCEEWETESLCECPHQFRLQRKQFEYSDSQVRITITFAFYS